MNDELKTYTNGEVTVHWKPIMCIHAGECVRNLKTVFNPKNRPWVNMEGGSTEEIKAAIDQCPSGALSYYVNENT